MQWNDHSRLVGQHAFLGASKYHWLNYDTDISFLQFGQVTVMRSTSFPISPAYHEEDPGQWNKLLPAE